MVSISKLKGSVPVSSMQVAAGINGSVALRCAGVSKRYGNVDAVSGLHLTAEPGQILALLGPSGCGKTTTLRLIAGFEQPDEGEISIGGQVISSASTSLPPEKRRIGMVFQEGALFPHLTVEQNIAYGLNKEHDRRVRVDEALELVGLSGMRRRMPHELSGGQQQRVALGRALAPRPEILLLDEPFSNLDAKLSEQLRGDVAAILRASGVTAVLVTHDQEAALQVGDQVALMNDGRVEQFGSPASVFHSPSTKYAAEFMGAVDFLPVSVVDRRLVSELGPLEQSESLLNSLDVGSSDALEIMIRPDCLECLQDKDGGSVIVDREFRGAFYLYRLMLPSGRHVRCLMSHVVELPVGSAVSVRLREGHQTRLFVNGILAKTGGVCS